MAAARAPAIACASDLSAVAPELGRAFTTLTGQSVRLAFGSSQVLALQIEQGAPFELFLSADEALVERLATQNLTRGPIRVYAIGHLALFAAHGSPLDPRAGLEAAGELVKTRRIRRFSIAHPEHAPYGRAARTVLREAGLWETLQPALVLGENAAQAMQFAASGSAQGGLVPRSLALASGVAERGTHALIDPARHPAARLSQGMALLRSASDTARAFHDFVGSETARELFVRYGFAVPQGHRA